MPAASVSTLERHCHLIEEQTQLTRENLEYLANERKESVSSPVAERMSVHLNEESAMSSTEDPWNTISTIYHNEHQSHPLHAHTDRQS